ncbi:MAG: transcription-repair coupling factor [Gemmatimonadota bacterium]
MALSSLLDAVGQLPQFGRLVRDLPGPRGERHVAGLAGSGDALLVAALSRDLSSRLVVVVTAGLPEAERWLADLDAIREPGAAALYPPREGFGEVEPHAEVAGERVETLARVARGEVRLLLAPARALQERTRLPGALAAGRLELAAGDAWRLGDLVAHLRGIGFEQVPIVDDVAQFAVRGGIVDIYSFGLAEPVRLEFWGDDLQELRHFDLLTQRTTRVAERVVILPVDGAGPAADDAERVSIASLFPPDTLLVLPHDTHLEPEFRRTWEEAAHHAELARRRGEDVPDRDALFERPASALGALTGFGTLRLYAGEGPDGLGAIGFPFRPPEVIERDIDRLRRLVADGTQTLILCDNSGQVERLDELLSGDGRYPTAAALVLGTLGGGFRLGPTGPGGLRVLTDHEIFRRERRLRRARRYGSGTSLEAVTALKPGDYVVHLEHGVGIYRGIERLFVGESTIEAAVVEYEGGDRLNVPLYRIDLLERYRAAGDVSEDLPPPRLHRLGGRKWQQQRDRTRAAIAEMTQELLDLYARRQVATRPAHHPDGAWQRQLESSFLFEDTPDQRKATVDVKRDMESPRPMDRLLVGDVGYGKTEIAIRAAFKAVQSGRQVAVLVPTTILADQHHRTITERLADFPVRMALLSRFQSAKEQAAVVAQLATREVDIVVGTHRLLSDDVRFADLGLVVVDEEHRFGVKHKEALKRLKLDTDVLTLTATPIPRTLHQAMAGLRDLTLIQTAPRDRSPVLTYLEPFDDALLEEAMGRELDRGGQVFFVHNRIETIEAMADHLRRLVPRARVGVAHGQMRERQLEDVMHEFVGGRLDVLVSTMIVETGLDVPNANTMFVNRADHFGLAQLYQLRGRVGRSHRRAYCYLIVPDALDEDAEKRLRVLEHHTELGAGYRVALRDLELRGAGNLLGPEQSGFVHAVGFDLYLRMLDEAVHRVQAGDQAPKPVPADVTLDVAHYLPDDYLAAREVKLDLYRRLSAATDGAAIDAIREELRDRFGPLPPPAGAFFGMTYLRVLGGAMGLESVLVRGDEARITFRGSVAPRLKGLSAAFHEVQFQAEVRRAQPLSLKLTRLGGASVLDGLVAAFRTLTATTSPN